MTVRQGAAPLGIDCTIPVRVTGLRVLKKQTYRVTVDANTATTAAVLRTITVVGRLTAPVGEGAGPLAPSPVPSLGSMGTTTRFFRGRPARVARGRRRPSSGSDCLEQRTSPSRPELVAGLPASVRRPRVEIGAGEP